MAEPLEMRLDKWLWAARFYKTRALAAEAARGGHVSINGARARPARQIRPQDCLHIRKAGVEFEITVLGLSARRGPALEAQQLYSESEQSRLRRTQLAELQRQAAAAGALPARRPDKRERRQIVRLARGKI